MKLLLLMVLMVPLIKSDIINHGFAVSSSYYTQTLSKLVPVATVNTLVPEVDEYIQKNVPAVEQKNGIYQEEVLFVDQRQYEVPRLGVQYAEKRPYHKKDRGTPGKKWVRNFDGMTTQVDISAMDLRGVLTPQVPSVSLLSPKGPYNGVSSGITEALYDAKTEEEHALNSQEYIYV